MQQFCFGGYDRSFLETHSAMFSSWNKIILVIGSVPGRDAIRANIPVRFRFISKSSRQEGLPVADRYQYRKYRPGDSSNACRHRTHYCNKTNCHLLLLFTSGRPKNAQIEISIDNEAFFLRHCTNLSVISAELLII